MGKLRGVAEPMEPLARRGGAMTMMETICALLMTAAVILLSVAAIRPFDPFPHNATTGQQQQRVPPPAGQAMMAPGFGKPSGAAAAKHASEEWGVGTAASARGRNTTSGTTSSSKEPMRMPITQPQPPRVVPQRRSLSAWFPFQALGFHSESRRSIHAASDAPPSPLMMPSLGKWVPKMARGLVAKQTGKVPATQQCWAPLCKPCKVPQPGPDALGGLRVFVLSHAGKSEGPVRQTIRQTWGARAAELGAKVEFVVSENLQQWGKPLAKAMQSEMEQNGDIRLVRITDFDNNTVEDGYQHLAYKVYSHASAVAPEMGPETWLMKLDSDTYMNPDRLALDIAEFRKEAKSSGGAWQYAGYFNTGDIQVKTSYGRNKGNKGDAWVEKEYGAKNSHYPPYAFGAAGWVLGYDALQEMLRRGRDPSVLRPKGASEDAMVGVLLEDCSRCVRKRWKNNQVLGGTHFPFASLIRRHGCPSLFERIGMAVADRELPSFRCFITITELKKASYIRAMSNIVKSAAANSPPGDTEVNLCEVR